jgi:WD40 repeat protein/serine/threonine protein kinase
MANGSGRRGLAEGGVMSERDLLIAALERDDPAERDAYLAQACGSDVDLRRRVERLLRLHEAGSFLKQPAAAPGQTVDAQTGAVLGGPGHANPPGIRAAEPTPPAEAAGTRLGPYTLLEKLGEGGMGAVWVAEQHEPIKRHVALKVIKPGMDSARVLRRFEAERQALALMDHTHIAKVFDAGATPEGRPYFVMELVQGVPLTTYCDQQHLTLRERLELFVPVCQALQHAHQKGIIHRDIKPSNVLVAVQDGRPVPKVIDFGLAKALHQRLTDQTMYTEIGQVLGTLEYMSPEQADFNTLDVDTRADVYSLGVVLYELLTGTTPLDPGGLRRAGFSEVLRQIREVEPSRPSTRLTESKESLARLAAQRRTDMDRLMREVRGELDWIVMKCLEKDRTRRYPTANGLARDVERYLRDESVEACPPSASYRLGKFARRHRAALAAASAFAALLVVGVVVSVWQAVRATAAERDAVAARDDVTLAASRFRDLARTAESNGYFSDIALAHREILADKPGRAERLLDGCPPHLRGWEWHYLKRQSHTAVLTIPAHDDYIFNVAYSPDGTTLATASQDGTARIFDAATGQGLRTLRGHEPDICWNVCYSPDGRWLASCGRDKTVRVWEMPSGRLFRTLSGHPDFVRSVAFSPDGRLLASGCVGVVTLWDTQTWQEIRSLRGGWHASFSPDGRLIGLCGGPEVQLWQTAALAKGTGDVAPILRRKYDSVSMAFSPDGQSIAFRTSGSAVIILDVPGGRELVPPLRHESPVWSVAFSPDGRCLASSEKDVVKVWDTKQGRLLRTFRGHINSTFSIAFAPDGRRLASASLDGTVKIWDVTDLKQPAAQESRTLRGPGGPVLDVIHSPVGRYFATVHGFAPEYGSTPLQSPPRVDSVTVWEATTCRQVRTLAAPDPSAGPCHGVAFDAPFARIAWARDNRTVELRDATSSRLLATLRGHTDFVWRVAFSPDGQLIASASRDATVRIWEASTGRPIHVLPGVRDLIVDLQFSPDGRRLVMVGEDVDLLRPNEIRIWDSATGQSLATLGKSFDSLHIALDADSRRLAHSVGAEIFLVDMAGEGQLIHLRGHTDRVLGLAFSPDGRRLVSAAHDGTVKLWEPETGREILSLLHGPNDRVNGVSFSPDGRQIVSVGESGAIKVWDASRLE